MKGFIVNYRGSHKTQNTRQIVINTNLKTKEEAEKLIGKKVVWKTPSGKEIAGEVSSAHGNTGAVRARFEKGVPGQALGDEVEIK